MTTRYLFIISLILTVFNGSLLAQKKIFNLQECVDTALYHNRNIKQQELNKKARELAYEQARMDLLPNLNASAGQSFTFGRSLTADNTYRSVNSSQNSFGINSSISLFDGLRKKYNIEARKAEMQSSEADLDKIKSDIELQVTIAYLQVLLSKENLQTQESQLELSQQKIQQMQALVEAGKLPEGELYELNAQLAKEELSLTQLQHHLKLALLDLAQLIELDEFENFDIQSEMDMQPMNQLPLSADRVYQSALQNRPEIKAAEYRLVGNLKNIDIARSAFYPSLNLGAQLGSGYYNLKGVDNPSFSRQMNDNLSTHIGFNLHIPIFNRFETKTRVQTSQVAAENSRIEMENIKLELRKKIEQAYQNAVAAQARYAAAQKTELASREAFRYAEQKYEAGRSSVYELYQAKSNLTLVLSELSQSKYEYLLRVKVLELLQ